MTTMFEARSSLDRLADLGLSVERIHRALARADAEVALVTELEPATAEGTTRYNKTTRYLREELIPLGWGMTNANNFCRTIHPSGAFAIVTCSGDAGVGVVLPGQAPSTQYAKGETTAQAVERNRQCALDLGPMFELPPDPTEPPADTAIWYLLYRPTGTGIACELSLPERIQDGFISRWIERIILPHLELADSPLVVSVADPVPYQADVDVVRRG